jgi:hypothetical protein
VKRYVKGLVLVGQGRSGGKEVLLLLLGGVGGSEVGEGLVSLAGVATVAAGGLKVQSLIEDPK